MSWNRYLNQWFNFLCDCFWLMCLCQSWTEIWVFNVKLNDLFHLKANLSFLFKRVRLFCWCWAAIHRWLMLGGALHVLTRHSTGHNPDRLRWYFLYFWQPFTCLCCCGVVPVNFKLEVLWVKWLLLMLSRVKLFQKRKIEFLAFVVFLVSAKILVF